MSPNYGESSLAGFGSAAFAVVTRKQAIVDAFYKQHGPCCAGCDWWRWHNTLVGECMRTAPVLEEPTKAVAAALP
jgi:hypothetical protein